MVAIPVAAVIISRAASNSIQYQAFVSLPARGRTVSLLFDSYCSETERVWQWSGAPAKNARRLLSVQKAWTKETSRPAVDTPGLTKPGVDELVSLGSRRGQPPLAMIGHARRLQHGNVLKRRLSDIAHCPAAIPASRSCASVPAPPSSMHRHTHWYVRAHHHPLQERDEWIHRTLALAMLFHQAHGTNQENLLEKL